jgi:hypothetical protein
MMYKGGVGMATTVQHEHSLQQRIVSGIIGGLAGGVVFGVMMAVMGMIPMIASMVGSDSAAVGWIIHFAISAFIGATFGLIFGGLIANSTQALGFGLLYGAVWWVLGALIAMPAALGMPLFMINTTTLMSLAGHLIFGAILGLTYVWYLHRS